MFGKILQKLKWWLPVGTILVATTFLSTWFAVNKYCENKELKTEVQAITQQRTDVVQSLENTIQNRENLRNMEQELEGSYDKDSAQDIVHPARGSFIDRVHDQQKRLYP